MWGAELVQQQWDEGRRGHSQDHMEHGRASGEEEGSPWSVLSVWDKLGAYLGVVWCSPSRRPSTACPGRSPGEGVADTQHGWHLLRR